MAEYSRLAKGSFTTNEVLRDHYVRLPFIPDTVKWWNYTARGTPTSAQVFQGYWDVQMGQGFATVDLFNTTPATQGSTTANILTHGITTFQAGLSLQYGPKKQIIGATAANPTVFNVTAHGFGIGDVVTFIGLNQSSTTGMSQIAGVPFTIIAVGDADHFTVQWDTSNTASGFFTALSGSPVGAFVKKVLYPYLYLPGRNIISAIAATAGSPTPPTTTITTTTDHCYVVGQEVGFHIPPAYGTIELNELPNIPIPAAPVYYYVVATPTFNTFVINALPANLTAFVPSQTFASTPGLQFPQVAAAGDVNTGGYPITPGSPLYPPPTFIGATGNFSTINGPAINGAFVNNTSQGFIFGSALSAVSQRIFYEATLHDYVNP
jgi:hypothetical protein